MGAQVKDPEYRGIRTDDSRIREAVKNMMTRGYDTDHIQRIVGMPREVIDKHVRDLKK